jgi:hypothetical protein
VVATGQARVLWVPPSDLTESALTLVGAELERTTAERAALTRTLDEQFDSGARLVPGPFRFGPIDARVFVVDGDRDRMRAALPPGLHLVPGLGARYVLIVANISGARSVHDPRTFAYRETTPLVPVLCERGAPGLFVPELYPDAAMPTMIGREIYGFPKRVARTWLSDGAADVVVDNRRILRARWGRRRALGDTAFFQELAGHLSPALARPARWASAAVGLPLPVYVRHRVPSRRRLRPGANRVDDLVSIPFRFDPFTQPHRLDEVDVRFADQHPVLHGDVLAGFAVTTGFRFGRARVVRRLTRSLRARWRTR